MSRPANEVVRRLTEEHVATRTLRRVVGATATLVLLAGCSSGSSTRGSASAGGGEEGAVTITAPPVSAPQSA